ncbi:receptor expression-enhancing protein 1 isoform X2 [Spea bombifrons]|uniref:receptor expression-enhancing protein 1 isoform X2 n=1 Tax=Spea bombifrons TaxID=233779 RepID=UPI00234B48D5|nr:receptor expression-enhancing protein 1 isoform X2 [Spea bombifrons]
MVSWLISRLVVLIFGTLYPAYYSYKAVKSKDIKEYVKWMMYWIIFALFMSVETFTDIFLCWFPFYYELKIAFVAWLLSPYTKGSSLLYRKFVHPTLSSKEKDIDECLIQAKDRSYDALVHFGKRGLNVAATAAVTAAAKASERLHTFYYMNHGQGQGALSERLRSFSMQDLSTIRGDPPSPVTVRAAGKTTKSKLTRSATQVSEASVVEVEVDESQMTCKTNYEIKEVIDDDDDEAKDYVMLEDTGIHFTAQKKKAQPIEPKTGDGRYPVELKIINEPPPRVHKPRFRKKGTFASTTETA